MVLGHRLDLRGRFGQHLVKSRCQPRVGALGVCPRQQQQVADQPAHPPRRPQRCLSDVGLLPVELLGQELEARQHACERGPELVRGVGDELALPTKHGLGAAAGRVEALEHPLERAGELRDLVLGLRERDVPARIAGALDLAGRVRQLDDRADRPLRGGQPGE